jgi:phage tail-like protein
MPTLSANAALAAATGLSGVRFDPFLPCNFLVEIEGLLVGGFSEVSGLECIIETEEIQEGGVNGYTHELPVRARYPARLTLKQGVTVIDFLWAWFHDVEQGVIERRNGTIFLLDRGSKPVMWWDFKDAYPVRWSGPQLRAESGQAAIETIELAHRGIVNPPASRALLAARAAGSAAGGLT